MIIRTTIYFLVYSFIFSFSTSTFANNQCEQLLNSNRSDVVKPLISAINKLELPTGLSRQESKFKENFNQDILKSLSFFRPSLENLPGGLDLFKLFENLGSLNPNQIRTELNKWANTHLPGYEILFLDDVKKFKFKNFYPNKNANIFYPETGTLDDKFLFELYSNKKIPILNVTDLVSKILVLAAPKLREQFEALVLLYQRGQALGDLNEDDRMFNTDRVHRPYASLNRLSYISNLIEMLTSRLVFISKYSEGRQLVLFGSKNLLAASLGLRSINLSNTLDLSLTNNKKVLEYFNQQALENNKSVLTLFDFLVKSNLLPKPAKDHMAFPAAAHSLIAEQTKHFDILRFEARIVSDRQNDNEEQAWIRFSNFIYHDRSHSIAQVNRYAFRFQWIEYYIKIVELDILSDEEQSQKNSLVHYLGNQLKFI